MLILLSPAKSLDYDTPLAFSEHSQPQFLTQSAALIEVLRQHAPADIARLMALSDSLANLNFDRYAAWQTPFTPQNARPAIFAFNGDVYDGFDAYSLAAADLRFAQTQLRILSGLYGILRPLDLMQAYRLEMGTQLATAAGKDLYAFWGDRLRLALDAELAAMAQPVLVNLASEEYFKVVHGKRLAARVIQPVFEDWKGGCYKIISFYAKKARGLMARYAVTQRLSDPEGLLAFASEGYAFAPEVSDAARWVFRRRQE
ncbi:peroxide stress protein YaaA [Azonexus sp.]|uniref:peroxide stress protein YaaA n=1 Tax=Azonexus sp. TaxID=1872668 RepID=UPI0039E26542